MKNYTLSELANEYKLCPICNLPTTFTLSTYIYKKIGDNQQSLLVKQLSDRLSSGLIHLEGDTSIGRKLEITFQPALQSNIPIPAINGSLNIPNNTFELSLEDDNELSSYFDIHIFCHKDIINYEFEVRGALYIPITFDEQPHTYNDDYLSDFLSSKDTHISTNNITIYHERFKIFYQDAAYFSLMTIINNFNIDKTSFSIIDSNNITKQRRVPLRPALFNLSNPAKVFNKINTIFLLEEKQNA